MPSIRFINNSPERVTVYYKYLDGNRTKIGSGQKNLERKSDGFLIGVEAPTGTESVKGAVAN